MGEVKWSSQVSQDLSWDPRPGAPCFDKARKRLFATSVVLGKQSGGESQLEAKTARIVFSTAHPRAAHKIGPAKTSDARDRFGLWNKRPMPEGSGPP